MTDRTRRIQLAVMLLGLGAALIATFACALWILWFVRTGTTTPFGYPAISAYVIALLGSAGAGIAIARIPARRSRVMA